MVFPRLAALLVVLALGAGAATAGAARTDDAPSGLRAFLLRADEPVRTSFPRTPAFAWNPYPGAAGYEFQLSTSNAFRDNGIVWRCPSATCPLLETPVAAPGVSLPWITGSPHGLYARVRAVMPGGEKTDWSEKLGFDVVPPDPPRPLASRPGLLRWTPVPGATGYQVWLVDAANGSLPRVVTVYTNVLDERDLYTFHEAQPWIGSVRWRVRALRDDWAGGERVNGVPIAHFGAWSKTYRSTNPKTTSGAIRLGATVSDVVSEGRSSDLAHRLMPAFTWSGDQSLMGRQAELFRVYVFTDRQCLNRVFTSPPVGGRAYAPRPFGGLAMPLGGADVARARGTYLKLTAARQSEPQSFGFDGEPIRSTESLPAAKPTTSLAGGAASAEAPASADLGAPVSLWDTEWPAAGYYWTVVPVEAASPGSLTSTLGAFAPKGSTTVVSADAPGFVKGDQVQVGSATTSEVLTVASTNGTAITFTAATAVEHAAGEPIVRLGTGVAYQDMELPQEACAAGRVARFGIDSEPSLVAGDDPFVSGLTAGGRLTSALRTSAFYKSPLVAWAPALGATLYEVQWSRTARPFQPVAAPGGAEGVLTGATSLVLPLAPGTWYYRVRGYDWSLPQGAQQMGWSEVAKVTITKPTFRVVSTRRR